MEQEINFPDENERKLLIKGVLPKIRELRRFYNNKLNTLVEKNDEEYNAEDLMRLVGTLEAAYNHAVASLAGDGDIYCLLKHLSYAIILAGEMNDPDADELYEIMGIITEGRVEACAACKQEQV